MDSHGDISAPTGNRQPLSAKAAATRNSLVVAAAVILRREGPSAVTYRHVAERAEASSSAVGYYFDSIDELLREAATFNIRRWGTRAERAASEAEGMTQEEANSRVVELLLRACLPEELVVPPAHYQQLLAAGDSRIVAEAYKLGRKRLDVAVERILSHAHIKYLSPRMVVAIVDGAAVAGISEGLNVRTEAASRLSEAVDAARAFALRA